MNFETTDAPTKSDVAAIRDGLNAFNYSVAPRDWRELAVFVRAGGVVVAGAYGASAWDWVHVKYLWVHSDHKEAGLGTRIMQEVEAEAIRRECVGIHLDTFSFQALPFYDKAGFEVFGQIEGYPQGHKRHYLKKLINPNNRMGSDG